MKNRNTAKQDEANANLLQKLGAKDPFEPSGIEYRGLADLQEQNDLADSLIAKLEKITKLWSELPTGRTTALRPPSSRRRRSISIRKGSANEQG